jgi:hypothetical protein
MRTLIAALVLAAPAVAQPLPIDLTTGRGSATNERVVAGPGSWADVAYAINPAAAQWRLAVIDTRAGLLTVTEPNGTVHTDVVPPGGAAGAKALSIAVTATGGAAGVVWSGYSGAQTTDYDNIPTVGSAYAGRLNNYPAGSTAVWSKVQGQPGDQGAKWGARPSPGPRFQLYAVIGGRQVLVISSY